MSKQWVKISEEKGGCYPHPLAIGMHASAGAGKLIYELIGQPQKGYYLDSLTTFGEGNTAYYFYEEQFEQAANDLFEAIKINKTIAKTIKNKHRYYAKRLMSHGKKIKSSDLSNHSRKQLLKLFRTQRKNIFKLWQWGLTISILEYKTPYISQAINKSFQKLQKGNLSTIQLLTSPTQKTYYRAATENLIAIARETEANSERKLNRKIKSKLKNHLGEFAWLNYYYSGPAASLGDIKQELFELIANPTKIQLKSLEELKKQQKTAAKKLKLEPSVRYLLKIARDFSYLKVLRKDALYHSFHAIDLILTEIANRDGVEMLHLRQLDADELEQLFYSEQKPNSQTISERHRSCAYLIRNGQPYWLSGEDYKKELFKVTKEEITQTTELKGQIANTGQAKGKVKIINNAGELGKMEPGDILVSIATNPTLVPAMKKAAAIVTDIGGITCHAAIISRELDIPCVIGTRVATKALNDGDFVDVDASRGKITIIKKG